MVKPSLNIEKERELAPIWRPYNQCRATFLGSSDLSNADTCYFRMTIGIAEVVKRDRGRSRTRQIQQVHGLTLIRIEQEPIWLSPVGTLMHLVINKMNVYLRIPNLELPYPNIPHRISSMRSGSPDACTQDNARNGQFPHIEHPLPSRHIYRYCQMRT